MEAFHFWFIVAIQIAGFIFVLAKPFISEKAKNLATKQDIAEITNIVESIKTSLAVEVEKLKSDLSYKNEHLIHLRASEREAIINYYKATWILILNITRTDFTKYEIDYFIDKEGKVSESELRRYISEAELILNKIKEELSNLKYLKDISESELMFFYDDSTLLSLIDELNLSLSEFEKSLIGAANSLLQVLAETTVELNDGKLAKEIIKDAKRKRSVIITTWYENKLISLTNVRIFNDKLKKTLHHRLKSLTS